MAYDGRLFDELWPEFGKDCRDILQGAICRVLQCRYGNDPMDYSAVCELHTNMLHAYLETCREILPKKPV